MAIFNEERSAYYKAKKREISRKREANRVVKEDALYIHYYGMTAYMELFPEAREFGTNWHIQIIEELENIRVKHLGQTFSGFYMASAATKDKGANRKFRKMIKDLTSR